jgi:hypothetical protein
MMRWSKCDGMPKEPDYYGKIPKQECLKNEFGDNWMMTDMDARKMRECERNQGGPGGPGGHGGATSVCDPRNAPPPHVID